MVVKNTFRKKNELFNCVSKTIHQRNQQTQKPAFSSSKKMLEVFHVLIINFQTYFSEKLISDTEDV